MLTGVRGTC